MGRYLAQTWEGVVSAESDDGHRLGLRILLVDDDPAVRRLVGQMLEADGYAVVNAESVVTAAEAIEAAGHPFDAAVLDVCLPDGQGFEIIERLRDGQLPCGVVLMTGSPSEEIVAKSIGVGVSEFLPKPYRRAELSRAVSSAIDQTRSWRQRVSAAMSGDTPAIESLKGDALRAWLGGDGGDGSARALELGWDEAGRIAAELADTGGLTERERETLERVLLGQSNPEIAASLAISANTVKYHMRNLLAKLELASRSDLMRFLVERGR